MKRCYFLLLLQSFLIPSFANDFIVTNLNDTIKEGDVITVDAEEKDYGFIMVECESNPNNKEGLMLNVKNSTNIIVQASDLSDSNKKLSLCCGGSCMIGTAGQVTKQFAANAGESIPFQYGIYLNEGDYGIVRTKVTVTTPNQQQTFYVHFNYSNNNTPDIQQSLNYTYNTTEQKACVTKGDYQGNIIIPPTIYHNGTTYTVTSIGVDAFAGCPITNVTIPNTITSIENGAFYACSSLSDITIPNSVISIGTFAFAGCTKLTRITIPNSIKIIKSEAFDGCTGLTRVEITDIAAWCGIAYSGPTSNPLFYAKHIYQDSKEITDLTIPSTVTSIGSYAYIECIGLTSINIPNSVTHIGSYTFSGCTNLTNISIDSNDIIKKGYTARNNLNSVFGSQVRTYNIGENITHIGEYAFANCSNIVNLIISQGVTSFGNNAFSGCTGLTSINIPNSVTTIGGSAFNGCTGFTSINIPNSVTTIGERAFNGCNGLTSINIPNSVTTIGNYAFNDCTELTEVTINSDNVVSTDYTSSSNLKTIFGTQVTTYIIGNNVKGIGDYAFYNCAGIKSINIPNSITSIGSSAFNGCTGLTSITIPNSLTSIGSRAFYYCTGLTSINIPNSVISIASNAFSGCTGLTRVDISDIGAWCGISFGDTSANPLYYAKCLYLNGQEVTNLTIPNDVNSIGDYVFSGGSLTSITIPNSVTTIGSSAFSGCKGLTEVTIKSNDVVSKNYTRNSNLKNIFGSQVTTYIIGEDVKGIGNYAFYKSTGLTSINIPTSVTSIGEGAFSECSNITSIVIPSSVTAIGEYAFSGCPLKQLVFTSDKTTEIGYSAFSSPNLVVVPSGSLSIYNGKGLKAVSIKECGVGLTNCTQATATFKSNMIEGITQSKQKLTLNENTYNVADEIVVKKLVPDTTYQAEVKGTWTIDGVVYDVDYKQNVRTLPIPVNLDIAEQTNLTMKLQGSCESDAPISKRRFVLNDEELGSGTSVKNAEKTWTMNVKNLVQGKQYKATFSVESSGKTFSKELQFTPLPIDLKPVCEINSPTSVTLSVSYEALDAVVEKQYVSLDGKTYEMTDEPLKIYGLEPSYYPTTYTYWVETQEGGKVTKSEYIYLPSLSLKTEPAQSVSNTKAFISAKTNGEDDAQRFGFEFRRYDAPDLVPSTVLPCPLYNGYIYGSLNNLSPTTYYKYRPFYKSDSGRMTYGEWSAFGTADAYVYFESLVHTYDVEDVTYNSAQARGYVLVGSDEAVEQGFEYWPANAPKDVQRITATGMLMKTTLQGLTPKKQYVVRSYVRTTQGTTYGEQKTFQTEPPIPGDVNVDGDVDVTDVVSMINFVLAADDEAYLDVNGDNKVNGADIVATANYVINHANANALTATATPAAHRLPAAVSSSALFATMNSQGIDLTLHGTDEYTGFQFLLTLPEGTALRSIAPNEVRLPYHNVSFYELTNGSYLVLGYQAANRSITPADGSLLRLCLEGLTDGLATISDVRFATPQAERHTLHGVSVGLTTNVETLPTPPATATGDVYDVQGRLIMTARDYAERAHTLPAGIYVMQGTGKFIVK